MPATALQLADNQNCHLGPIVATDVKGNPANVNGVPTWTTSDATVVTVAASADGLSADISAVGPLTPAGSTIQIIVTANADMDPAGAAVDITGEVDVTVVSSQATSLGVPAGTPTNQ